MTTEYCNYWDFWRISLNSTETAVLIEMPIDGHTRAGSKHYVLGVDAHCRHLAITIERSVDGVNGWNCRNGWTDRGPFGGSTRVGKILNVPNILCYRFNSKHNIILYFSPKTCVFPYSILAMQPLPKLLWDYLLFIIQFCGVLLLYSSIYGTVICH